MRERCTEERGAVGTKEFYENEKKERIFLIPSSTSRTLIRRSGFTLTLSNPPASSCRVALSFSFSHRSLIPPSSYPCPYLSRCSSISWRL